MNEGRKISIVIADDLEAHRRRLERIIKGEKDLCLLYSASSGREVVEAVRSQPPDIVLMDVEMEDNRAGINAAKEINCLYPNIRIIIVTVHNDEKIICSAFQTGIVDFLLKDEAAKVIVQAIRSAMDNTSPIRPYIAEKLRSDYRRSRRSEESLMRTIKIMTELTEGEINVIRLLREGKKRREVAEARFVSEDTIKKQINSLLKKSGKKNTKTLIAELESFGIFTILDTMI